MSEKQHEILAAIEEMRMESRARGEETSLRLTRMEEKVDATAREHDARFRRLEDEVTDVRATLSARAKQDADFAEQMTKVAGAAANAADIGLKAMRRAEDACDDMQKVIKSALTIHNASIASSVSATVTSALAPVLKDVDVLKQNDEKQNASLTRQDDQLLLVVALLSKLARWQNHWAIKVLFGAGVFAAGWWYATRK